MKKRVFLYFSIIILISGCGSSSAKNISDSENASTYNIPSLENYEIKDTLLGIDDAFLEEYIKDDLNNYVIENGYVYRDKVNKDDSVTLAGNITCDEEDITPLICNNEGQITITAGSDELMPLSKELEGLEIYSIYESDYIVTDDNRSFENYLGKTIHFNLTIISIVGYMDTPDLTDEFISSLGQSMYSTVDEYKAVIRDSLEEMELNQFKDRCKESFWTYCTSEINEEDISEVLIAEKKNERRAYYEDYLKENNLEKDELLKQLNVDNQGFEELLYKDAFSRLKNSIVIEEICKSYDIKVDQDEVEAYKYGIILGRYSEISEYYKENGISESDLLMQLRAKKIEEKFLTSKIKAMIGDK